MRSLFPSRKLLFLLPFSVRELMPGGQRYQFDQFTFDTTGNVLRRSGEMVDLKPKEGEALRLLLENHDEELVTREFLLEKLWPDEAFPSDGRLTTAISKLNTRLGRRANGKKYIRNYSKRGYSFEKDVKIIGPPPAEPPKIMLAVLPFENLSAKKGREYFSQGLTDDMITMLSRLNPERLGVIARATSSHPKLATMTIRDIGRELGVAYVLTGSVQSEGSRVRINAQLAQVRDEAHVWTQSYERKRGDILALQSEVVRAIAGQIRIKLVPHEEERLNRLRTVNPRAYDDYLRGRYLWNERTPKAVEEAAALFEKAVAQDPLSSMAYSALADCYAALGSQAWMSPGTASKRARAAALRAMKIDDNFAGPHASLGFVETVFEYRWPQAEQAFQRALELNHNYSTAHHWHAFYLAAMGRMPEALDAIRRAQRIDPLSRMINTNVATMLYWAREREYDAAIEQCHDALGIDPDFWNAHSMLALALEQKKQYKAAITEHRRAIAVFPGKSAILVACYARTCALAGDAKQARELLRGLHEKGSYPSLPMFQIGLAHAALGETDAAFRCLRESFNTGEMWIAYIKVDPRMDALRADRRYRELMTGLGLR